MAQVNKIDSNATGLRWALEASLKTLGGSPVWYPLEPNSYGDFGGQVTTVSRQPIAQDRQRRKGTTTDLDADGRFTHDFVHEGTQDLLPGLMYAAFREKGEEVVTAVDIDSSNPDEYEVAATAGFLAGSIIKGSGFTNAANNGVNVVTAIVADTSVEVADGSLVAEGSPPAAAKINVVGHRAGAGDIDVDVSGDFATYTSSTLDFTTLGLNPGEWIFVGGDAAGTSFSNEENNGWKRLRSIAANALVVDKSLQALVTEASTSETIEIYFGRIIKNETGSNIVRSTYQLERSLGAPDDGSPSQIQGEYLEGSLLGNWTLNIRNSDKTTAEFEFMAADHTQVTGPTGLKAGTRPDVSAEDVYNASSDVKWIKMMLVSATSEAPTALFAYVTDLTLTVNNNLSANKAVGVLGAFDFSAGTFQVGGNVEAYFTNVASIQAVRNNSDVTMHAVLVKDNAGIAFDLPLISLGDGRLNVRLNEPVKIPLSTEAVSGVDVAAALNHTLLFCIFDYLPDAADT